MNKKYLFFVITALSCGSQSLFSITSAQDRTIRKDLYSKYAQNMLNRCQLIESDMSIEEVIDRDLKIITEHKNRVQLKIDANKGFIGRKLVPVWNVLMASVLGSLSSVSGCLALGAYDFSTKTTRGDGNFEIWMTDKLFSVGKAMRMCSPKDEIRYKVEKCKKLNADNPELFNIMQILPVATGVAVIGSLLFIKRLYTLCTYKSKLDSYIKKSQDRWNRDQAIIARLKEIKQEITQSIA